MVLKPLKFVPRLSIHKLRLLRKIFVDNLSSKENLINSLREQIDIVNPSNMGDHVKTFCHHNAEKIRFQATCSLLLDLLEARWNISISLYDLGFVISKPDYNKAFEGSSTEEIKNEMRKVQLVNRNKQVESLEFQNFISRMERPKPVGNEIKSILNLIDNGKELSEIFTDISSLDDEKKISLLEKIIQPEIVVCFPDDPLFKEEEHKCPYTGLRLTDIWKYFRLTWSSEYKSVPGKSFPLLIRNAARPNKPIIGIAMLRSAALADKARDDLIGWTDEPTIREKIYKKKIEVEYLVSSMLDCLEEQIESVRWDDIPFINRKLLKFPNNEILKKLNELYQEEYEKRHKDLEHENDKTYTVHNLENTDFARESERSLFKKKRAAKLARLLEARKLFNEVNLEKYPSRGYATLIHKSNEKGKEIISRVLREIRLKALAENIMDVSVCGSVHPYSEIIGGKLIASLMASQEVRNLFRERYYSKKYRKPAIIASSNKGEPIYRDANLMCLTTTSLYGVSSSQYNRIKFLKKDYPKLLNDVVWTEIKKNKISQKTKGQGVYHFSDYTNKLLGIVTRKSLGRVEVNYKFGEGTSPKLRNLRKGIDILKDSKKSNIQIEDFFAHNIQRKNYIMFYDNYNLSKFLKKNKPYGAIKASSAKDISNAWIKRWLLNRIKRDETLEKLKNLGPNTVVESLKPKNSKNNVVKINKRA